MEEISKTVALLGEQILASEQYLNYQKADAAYQSDPELSLLVGQFDKQREALVDARGEEKPDSAKIETLQKEMQNLYTHIMSNAVMKEYNDASTKFEDMMKQVYSLLNTAVFGEQDSCTHDCSSCSGCH